MVICIVGPTGTGKSELGIYLAKKLNGEIINSDSTQVYKGMNICTNKVLDTEGIVHHLFDEKDLKEDYTVYDFQRDSRKIIDDILNRGKVPILVGGTGLYVKACLYDYEFLDYEKEDFSNYGDDELYDMLIKVDPKSKVHSNNRIRVENALNYYKKTGRRYSEKEKSDNLLYNTIFIGLTCDRNVLYDRINDRVDKMVLRGLIDECHDLYNSSVRSKAVLTPIGPKELFEYFDGNVSLDEAIDNIKSKSRKYAKRQYTWFNNQMDISWFSVNYDDFSKTEEEILNFIKKNI